MPVRKGTNNFYQHTRLQIESVKIKLELELDKLRNSKVIFKNLSHANDYLAKALSESIFADWQQLGESGPHPKDINKSTLYRNIEYRSKIETYIGQQKIRGSSNSPIVPDSVKIAELQIELSNKKHEISVLRRYIEKLNAPVESAPTHQALPVVDNLDIQKTAQALALLLEASEGQFALRDGCLINMTKRIDNVIAPQTLMAPFLKWLKAQEKFNE